MPFPWGSRPTLYVSLGPQSLHPNGTSIGSSIFAGLTGGDTLGYGQGRHAAVAAPY